jgi:hypothetical protein
MTAAVAALTTIYYIAALHCQPTCLFSNKILLKQSKTKLVIDGATTKVMHQSN